jgi:hypothetical protein
MGFSLPSGVINTNSAYFYADDLNDFGTLVKELSDQTLIVLDYSNVTPAITLTSYSFAVDVSSNPALVVSYPQIGPLGEILTFLVSGGIPGQEYTLTVTATYQTGTRNDTLTIAVPSSSGDCVQVNPVPAIYNQLPLGTQGYINAGVRYFWGAAAPANPGVLDQWYDPTTDTLSEWTTDGTTFFWSILTTSDLVTEAPIDSILYSRYNGHWVANVFQVDAPSNSQSYSRNNNTWMADAIQTDAPMDSTNYVRNNGGWKYLPPAAIGNDAPSDNKLYGRYNAGWTQVPTFPISSDAPNNSNAYVRSGGAWASGGSFVNSLVTQGDLSAIGSLSINGSAWIDGVTTFGAQVALPYDPIQPLQAATKQYVDGQINDVKIDPTIFVHITGSTMTGALILSADPTSPMQAADKQYVDNTVATATAGGPFLSILGGTITGNLTVDGVTTLGADPVNPFEAATKHYVDINSTGGIGDAPLNANVYGRSNGAWVQALAITGGVLTGPLTLQSDPTAAPQAATKNYVDTSISTAVAAAPYLRLSGGTLTGALILNAVPTTNLGAATKSYVDTKAGTALPLMNGNAAIGTSSLFSLQDHVHPSDTSRYAASNPSGYQTAAQVTASLAAYLPLLGGTLVGALTLSADPTNNLGAATKQYVDAGVASAEGVANTMVPLAGGTMTGLLILSAPPTANLGAATKGYVDTLTNSTIDMGTF